MPFWKRKRKQTGKEAMEDLNRDFEKAQWLQKILTPKEFTDFNLSMSSSYLYLWVLEGKEPKKNRPDEMKTMMTEFQEEMKHILKNHTQAPISERDQQVEELIRQAEFSEERQYTPSIYYHFRTMSDDERRAWDYRNDQIHEAILRH